MTLSKPVFAAAAAVLLTLTALPANAQSMKPGLWEVTSKMGGNPEMDKAMAQMQQQMASMPPEQRKMMEDMLAKQGVGGMGASAGGFSTRMCITKEMADRNQMPVQQQGDCKTTISDKTATGMKMAFTCTNPPSSGEGQFSFTSDSAYSMKMKVNSNVQGKAQTTTMDGAGKFVAADCGSVKPMAVPKG